jgi:uncharacterized repeat protein (TIGR01451 family)
MLWLAWIGIALWPLTSRAQDADCAEVKIVIDQKLSLERQAFDAHLVINNGLDDAISNVKVELSYLDQNQQPVVATTDPNAVGATFFQRTDTMSGINALDGSGTVAGQSTADVHWLIIPSQGAGGDTADGRLYYIGAKITYTLAGVTTSVDVTPDYVVVRPQPLLALDYFLPSDVYGDDPLTPQVEPTLPFTLGVRIANIGAGTSTDTTIDSAQPKIVDNNQGLLINFEILGGYVGNDMVGKSLLLDFGDIAGQSAKVGRWIMQTSLAGRFTEFNASFTHADTLGGAVTSLIQSVSAHTLVHDVLVDVPGSDNIYDFLAEAGAGYRVYGSDGFDADVVDVSGQSNLSSISSSTLRLSFPVTPNLIHAKVSDPFAGAKPIARVVRSDGKVLPTQNFWLSKTRNIDLSWSYYLHIFDSATTGDYTLEFAQGATGSISGMAYQDANANGVRDAGEPAQGNLGIVLKGIDANGQNVLAQAYTDPSGAFSFTGLSPGVYQLEAAVLDGWIDGAWVAGSAGGTAQSGLISGIQLTAGTAAQGYLIAKTKPNANPSSQDADQADLSIAIQAGSAQLHGGEATNVTVTVRNAGEATAQTITAQVAVPSGLTLQSSSASLGSYTGGIWTLSSLPKGQNATLTLGVQAQTPSGSQDSALSWPVSVSASTVDPQSANNSALLGLTVLADNQNTLQLTQNLPAQARVLMLLACPQTDSAAQADCEDQAAQQAQAVLAGHVQQLQTVTTLSAWNQAERSGTYNMLWLHGGAEKLDAQALAELRAAVRRGATVIVDGLPGPASGDLKINQLADMLGAQILSPDTGGAAVQFPGQPVTQPVAGLLYGLQLQAQTPAPASLATAAGASDSVMSSATWGQGQAWTAGFDLLEAAQGTAATFWGSYVDQQLLAFTPITRTDPALAGERIPLATTVQNNAQQGQPAQSVSVDVQIPSGVSYSDATPAPTSASAQQLQWSWSLAPGQSQQGQLQLLMPQASGAVQIQTTASSGGNTVDTKTQSITVVGLDSLAPQIIDALAALTSSDPDAQTLIAQAVQAANAASVAQQQGDWSTALEQLAALQAALDQLALAPYALPVDIIRLDVARWIGVAQQQWTPAGAPQPDHITVQSGAGQSALVSSAFANPLVALVQDAQNQPVAGVSVRFTAPASGAGAAFGGSATADVTTDAQGLATSPALTANASVGSYAVTAQVDGLAPVTFDLSNHDAGVDNTPASVRLVSGSAQTAQVGTAFGAPMVVQVLNAEDQPLQGIAVQFTFAATGASASFAGGQLSATVSTDAQGQASSPAFSANTTAGSYQASATVSGLSAVGFTLNNSAAAPALLLQSVGGMTQSATVGTAYGERLSVRVVDAQNNPKAGVAVLFTLPASGPSASFEGGGTSASVNSGADGTTVSPLLTANSQPGEFSAQVSASGAAQALYATLTNLADQTPPVNPGKRFESTTATGTGLVVATISGGGDNCVFNPSATRMVLPQGQLQSPPNLQLPHGLFAFELVGCDPGSEVTMTTVWPQTLKGITGFMKHGPTPQSGSKPIWYSPSNVQISGNTVTFTVRDGQLGDDDLTANGVITDPGGPVVADEAKPIPALGGWMLGLLAALMGLGAIATIANRRRGQYLP